MPPWSFSSLNNYLTCPAQFEALRVSKRFKQEETEHTRWGTEVHEAIEKAIRDGEALPERMRGFSAYVDSLLTGSGDTYVELELAIDSNLEPTEFLADNVWTRGIVDFLRIKGRKGFACDHKTGKRKEGSRQLKQNAGLIFAHFPELEELVTGYGWLQEGGKIGGIERFTRADIPKIWAAFDDDLRRMAWSFEHNAWPKNKSGLCGKWCPVVDCEHNGRGKKR